MIRIFRNISFLVIPLLIFSSCGRKKVEKCPPPGRFLSEATRHALQEWQQRKFSMFIHWGLYSIPAGVWEGKKERGYSEQIQGHARIPKEEYEKLAEQFNPLHWNPDSVALLAKRAGMRTIIFTAKHHDGFCMFRTKYTKYNVVDATPYHRDVVGELAEACRRHGLKFGVYYSLIDWHYPGALPFTSTRNSDSIPPKHHRYNLHQVEELLTRYGPISEIWFDMGSPTPRQSREVRELVKSLQPGCLISGRLWNDQGDFVVMGDNYRPSFHMGVPWQTPASMFRETWGYRSWQERGDPEEKAREKLQDLLHVVSMGGNYLLNIGPTGDGRIIPFERKVLESMGRWLSRNGEGVYGTRPVPLIPQSWGVVTARPEKLYLHILKVPQQGILKVAGLHLRVKKITPLSNALHSYVWRVVGDTLLIRPGPTPADTLPKVLCVDIEGSPQYTPEKRILPDNSGTILLTAGNAVKYHSLSGHDYYSQRPTVVRMQWRPEIPHDGEYTIRYAGTPPETYCLIINGQPYPVSSMLKETLLPGIRLEKGNGNLFLLRRRDLTDPHKGLIRELQILVRPM